MRIYQPKSYPKRFYAKRSATCRIIRKARINARALAITIEEQNSLGSGKILPEYSKQNISRCVVCSPKKGLH